MTRWKFCSVLVLVLAMGAIGCGSSSSSTTVTLVISPTSASVITNTTQQFASLVTGSTNTTVTWTVTCATVTNPTATVTGCGTIDANGLYTAPATIPTATISGTITPEPTATITGTSAADTTKTETATVTIITGISIAITPVAATVGTGEHFTFTSTVNNPGCNTTSNANCLTVTWSVPTTTGSGSIDANGVYTAPATAPSPSSVTITATSVADTSITATATVTIVTASDPTVSAVSPSTAALGSLFQDIYITGTNFLSTSIVYLNGALDSQVTFDSSSLIRARLSPTLLSSLPPSGIFTVSVSQQVGSPQTCSDPSKCQVVVTPVRPVIVGPSPDSIPQSQVSSAVQSFNVNGGFFGTSTSPAVSATYDGQPRAAQFTSNATRQISVTIGGSSNSQDFSQAGLHQVTIRSNADPTKFSSANLAVQPDAGANPPSTAVAGGAVLPLGAGKTPSDVAINSATGMAVIANTGTNDVTLVDLSAATPAVITASICTGALGTAAAPCSPVTGPKGVAVAHLVSPAKNIALVANSSAKTISEIDLDAKAVIWVSPTLVDSPIAVGINPVTGRALVAMSVRPYGLILDLNSVTPTIVGPVSITTGTNAHVAVEPHLNWAISTPGGNGSIGIVDLSRQTANTITTISRTTNVVTVSVQASTTAIPQSPLGVQVGDAIQIQGVSDNSFNGIYLVSALGPGATQFSYSQTGGTLADVASFTISPAGSATLNYSKPVATLALSSKVQGVGINPETETAVLVDPSATGVISFFSLIDQSITSLAPANSGGGPEPGASFAAFNQLTNTAYVVNTNNSTLSVIDPTKPRRLPAPSSTFATGTTPVAVAVDPASNRLVVVNQGDNSVSIFSLGASGTVRPIEITETNPKVFLASSTLNTAPSPAALTLSVFGKGLTCTNSSTTLTVRLDGTPLSTACVSATGDRGLTATVPPSLLAHARRFTLDVRDSVSGTVSNASDFTVEQSIGVTGCSASPFPSGVAVDAQQNIAAVTLAGCNAVALINLATGTGQTVAVGSTPLGVAAIPRLHQVVVANNGSNSASVVDELGATVVSSPSTDSGSIGVGVDQDTGEAAVTNSVANTVTILNLATAGTTTVTTGQFPVAVGFNYQNHEIAVAADGGAPSSQGSLNVGDAASAATSLTFSVVQPTSVIYDPVTGDLGNDCGSTSNNTGCFLVNSSGSNLLNIIDPITQQQLSFRIGINPTALAYNPLTSTIVSTNTISHTVTVGDFLDQRIRAVLTLPAAPTNSNLAQTGTLQFAVDIQPLTNLAVIADTANGRVLFIPIPR